MKVTQAINFKSLLTLRSLAMLMMVAMLAVSASAQKSRSRVIIDDSGSAKIIAAPSSNPDLDQCANGARGTSPTCVGNWQNGNVNAQNSQWIEGQSLAYRATFTGTPGTAGDLTIEYDTTKSGKHALDYLTTYNQDLLNGTTLGYVHPCDGKSATVCDEGNTAQVQIPTDPTRVTSGPDHIGGTSDDITQPVGFITVFAGTGVALTTPTIDPTYVYGGDFAGDSTNFITVHFTFPSTGSVVISWGGHIARRLNWGADMAAINVSGSPYHTVVNGGSNCSMKVAGIIFPATVTIIKLVNNDPTLHPVGELYRSTFVFGFTNPDTRFAASPGTFSLVDSDAGQFQSGTSGTIQKNNVTSFGAANSMTITENNAQTIGARYNLGSVGCVIDPYGLPNTSSTTVNTVGANAPVGVTIVPGEGNNITCTFTNLEQRPTAAMVAVSGRVLTPDGRGLRGATVTMTNSLGEKRTVTTSSFGTYTFVDVSAGESYVMGVASKTYRYATQLVQVNDTLTGVDFYGQE